MDLREGRLGSELEEKQRFREQLQSLSLPSLREHGSSLQPPKEGEALPRHGTNKGTICVKNKSSPVPPRPSPGT